MYSNLSAANADRLCRQTLHVLHKAIKKIAATDPLVGHYTQYAIIVCSGALERSFKAIISDYVAKGAISPIANYIDKTIRRASSNPSVYAIRKVLDLFDMGWGKKFEDNVKMLPEKNRHALGSIVGHRNSIAHGNQVTISLGNVFIYYYRARVIIRELESILC